MHTNFREIVPAIRAALKDVKLGQIAKQAKVHVTTLQRIRNGEPRGHKFDTLMRIADALGLSAKSAPSTKRRKNARVHKSSVRTIGGGDAN